MEMDDILAEFDARGEIPHSSTSDIETLTKFWIAERTAPEILPYQNDILERVMERVRAQVSPSNISIPPPLPPPSTTNPPFNTVDRQPRKPLHDAQPHYLLPLHPPPNRARADQIPDPLLSAVPPAQD